MRVLAFRQPYAELVLNGKKKIDIRKRDTLYRGPVLIHVSKTVDKAGMKKFGFSALPTGCLVGIVDLSDTKKYQSAEEFEADMGLHLVGPEWGNHSYILENPRRIVEIPIAGQIGWWHYDGEVKLKN